MALSLISARRSAEYQNLLMMWRIISAGIVTGAAGTTLAFLFGGRGLDGRIGAAAALGQAALLAGMAVTSGGLLGFMFGVPRTRGNAPPGGSEAATGTNLEQVSDWLTKMIVGAALVSLSRLPGLVDRLQAFVTIGDGSDWGARMGLLVTLYFAVLGFVAGYTLTRMQYITLLDRAPFVNLALEALQRVPIGPDGVQRTNLSLEELNAVERFSRVPERQLQWSYDLWNWAKAQLVASDGDLRAAARVYERLLKSDANPQMEVERAVLAQRLGGGSGAAHGSNGTEPEPEERPLSAQALVDRMFRALYDPPPEGFEAAIRIGEELVRRVQDDAIWAYLACAYGQRYRHLMQQPGTTTEQLGFTRERALFSVKQTLDLNAARWRPILRSLWDRNAVRSDGEDDLVAFSGDQQFAVLLDPDPVAANAGPGASQPSLRLVRYNGVVQIWIADAEGQALAQQPPTLNPGCDYRLIVQLSPTRTQITGRVVHDIRITQGDDRPKVDFEIQPDGVEMRFSPLRSAVTVSEREETPKCGFDFRVPPLRQGQPMERELYVEIAQGRQIVRTVPLKVKIARANGSN